MLLSTISVQYRGARTPVNARCYLVRAYPNPIASVGCRAASSELQKSPIHYRRVLVLNFGG